METLSKSNISNLTPFSTARQILTALGIALFSVLLLATAHGQSVLAGWDTSTLAGGTNNFGPSPFAPTTLNPNISSSGFIRGTGVSQSGSAVAGGWGGTNWVATTEAAAITASTYFTFTLRPAAGTTMSLASLNPFSYRRSGTGPTSGALQYSTDGSSFTDIATYGYTSTSSSGATLASTSLGAVAALQNVPDSTTITFRVVNWGASGAGGTWYVYDVGGSTSNDFAINGTITPVPEPATVLGGALLVGVLGWNQCRRLGGLAGLMRQSCAA